MSEISALITLHSPENGGRHALPVGSGYSPYLSIEDGLFDVAVRFIDTPEKISFDREYPQLIEIMYPNLEAAKKLKAGKEFRILEGNKIIGTGVVLNET